MSRRTLALLGPLLAMSVAASGSLAAQSSAKAVASADSGARRLRRLPTRSGLLRYGRRPLALLVLGLRRVAPRVPASLVAVIVGVVAVNALALDEHGVDIVGPDPERPAGRRPAGREHGPLR